MASKASIAFVALGIILLGQLLPGSVAPDSDAGTFTADDTSTAAIKKVTADAMTLPELSLSLLGGLAILALLGRPR